jgi:hypothetical protein
MTEIIQRQVLNGIKTDLVLDGDDLHVHRSYVGNTQKKINELREESRDASKKIWHGNKDEVPLFYLDELELAFIRKHYGHDITKDVPELIRVIEKHFPHAKVFHGSMV